MSRALDTVRALAHVRNRAPKRSELFSRPVGHPSPDEAPTAPSCRANAPISRVACRFAPPLTVRTATEAAAGMPRTTLLFSFAFSRSDDDVGFRLPRRPTCRGPAWTDAYGVVALGERHLTSAHMSRNSAGSSEAVLHRTQSHMVTEWVGRSDSNRVSRSQPELDGGARTRMAPNSASVRTSRRQERPGSRGGNDAPARRPERPG